MAEDRVKFLFIRFSSIGDIILTTPLLRVLKAKMPQAEIHYLTKDIYEEVLKFNPYIAKLHLYNHSFSTVINNLKAESFDYIIDLHRNARSFRVKNALGRVSFSFDKLNFRKWIYVNLKKDLLPDIHIVDRYFETLSAFEIQNDSKGLNYFFNEEEVAESIKDINLFKEDYIALVIGAKHATKRLPVEKLIELSDKLNLPVVLLGDIHDAENGLVIQQRSTNKVINTCGRYSLNESVYILKHASLVITHDTGLMHIAAALHKKIISIWGNTVPEFGMYPYMPQMPESFSIFEVKNLACRPCSKIGFNSCPKKHFKCMMDIDINEVIKKSTDYLGYK
jgi:ADP-heptose:LPS heptosyltransferase